MLKIQRFKAGDPFYTEKQITNTAEHCGVVGTFGTTFGQIVNADGNKMSFCLERTDTLIPEGEYDFDIYDSPVNKCEVVRLLNVTGHEDIEIHPANWAYQLKGCCAPCTSIDLNIPQGNVSRTPFNTIMEYVKAQIAKGVPAKITYETI